MALRFIRRWHVENKSRSAGSPSHRVKTFKLILQQEIDGKWKDVPTADDEESRKEAERTYHRLELK